MLFRSAAKIAKEALRTKSSVRDLILEKKLMTPEELDLILDPYKMTEPGIQGRDTTELFK